MYNEIIESKKEELDLALEYFKEELAKIRTGRANTALVENVMVDYYGAKTPLKQLASITIPEARLISVNPWDKGSLLAIESAIRTSDLGLNPTSDGQIVRINIPPLTEERRKELAKVLNQKAEDARITVRNIREDAWREIQDKEKSGAISEDDKFKGKDRLQTVVDDYNEKIEEIRNKKEKEIMTV
jgi:ribosome recycling factor